MTRDRAVTLVGRGPRRTSAENTGRYELDVARVAGLMAFSGLASLSMIVVGRMSAF